MRVQAFDPGEEPLESFIELPWRVYRDDPGWIPPVRKELRQLLSPENPFLSYGRMRLFLAGPPDGPRARAAAIVNPRLEHEGEPVGQVGFFEAMKDHEPARAVLDEALGWLDAQGLRRVWGPMDGSIWHGYRLMTEGFDRAPFLGEPHNPPWYPERFARAGFEPLARWYSWDLDEPALRGIMEAAGDRRHPELLEEGYRLRPLRIDRFQEDLRILHRLVMDGFRNNLGFCPMDFAEFDHRYGSMRHLVIPELIRFVHDPGDEPVGFGYVYPDHAEAMRAMNGRSDFLARLRFVWKKRRPERAVLHTMAFDDEVRGMGLVQILFHETLAILMEQGLTRAVGALAQEGPTIYAKTGEPSREYTLFETRTG